MPLPPPRKAGLRAGRQMQVEPCEIPFAGAPEILRSEAYIECTLQRLDLLDNTLGEFCVYQVP